MTETIGLKLLSFFKEPIQKISKDFKEEFLHLFNNGLVEYIDNFHEKFSKTKTFIYRDENVNFYDIFFSVTLQNSKNEKIDSIKNLDTLFSKRRFITIIGTAGSGKSMLMKHIFLSAATETTRIPIVVELRNLNDYSGSIFDYINNILIRSELANNQKFIDRILKEGTFLFLFDGYDEIFSTSKNKITRELEEFVDTYNKNTFVVTSRPGSNAEALQRFDNFWVKALSQEQIREFVKLQYRNHENRDSLDRILNVIEKPDNNDFKDYLSNPLLLSMFIFTFNSYPEIPKYKNKFYWNVFDTLCTKHDAFTKNGFWLHERKSKLLNDDFENILKWFSYISLFKGKYSFDYNFLKKTLEEISEKLNISANTEDIIYDLSVSISILIVDGIEYTFPHKSLQEYFTATLIKGLNEAQKEIIYKDKFKHLEKYSNGGNLNLFKLCYELDKYNFSKFYLIPNAKKFIESIDNSDDIKFFKSFIKVLAIDLMIDKNKNNKYRIEGYSYNNKLEDSFLSFFTNIFAFPKFSKIEKALPLLLKDLESSSNKNNFLDMDFLNIANLLNKKNQEFAIASGLNENFRNIYNQVKENLEKTETEVANENDNTFDLLKI